MKIIITANYKKMAKEKGCSECGSMAVGEDGLCWKCHEEEERAKEKYRN